MQDLRLIGVHEDGLHLLLAGPDGEHYTVPIDDALRSVARRDRPRSGQLQIEIDGGMRPREVQSLIRAGLSTEEVADRAGWPVDKVHRYEGAILAERAHIADQARQVRVRTRGGSAGSAAPTLQSRVGQRMRERGVDPDANAWDAWRAADATSWTVTLTFAAGGRQRQAAWLYDPVLRTVDAVDDEARWLSADEAMVAGPLPAPPARTASVYDVEAEGGVAATSRRASGDRAHGDRTQEPVDLMTAMRQRTTVSRRSGRRRSGTPSRHPEPAALPLDAPIETSAIETSAIETSAIETSAIETGAREVVGEGHHPERRGHVDPVLPGEIERLEPAGAEVPPLHEEPPVSEPAPGSAEPDLPSDDAEANAESAGTDPHTEAATEPEPAARAQKRRPRTSVPSWDDIMFGAKRD